MLSGTFKLRAVNIKRKRRSLMKLLYSLLKAITAIGIIAIVIVALVFQKVLVFFSNPSDNMVVFLVAACIIGYMTWNGFKGILRLFITLFVINIVCYSILGYNILTLLGMIF